MNLDWNADPLWPWPFATDLLASAGPLALTATALVGLWALSLPVLLRVRPLGLSLAHYLRHGLLVLAALLLTLALALWHEGFGFADGSLAFVRALLLVSPCALLGLTAWLYLGSAGARPGRVAALLALRVAALLLTALAFLRPILGFPESAPRRGTLYLGLDASRSMTIRDEAGRASRWEAALAALEEARPLLDQLRDEHRIDISLYRFAGNAGPLDLNGPGEPDGALTDIGRMLRDLYEPPREGQWRALLLISDGAHNGSIPPLGESVNWQQMPASVHTFACGNRTTSNEQNDIDLKEVVIEPSPVPIKGKFTVTTEVAFPGFEDHTVRFRLFLDGKEAAAEDATLKPTRDREGKVQSVGQVALQAVAPDNPGEVRVTVKVEDRRREGQPPPGDRVPSNNVIETFLGVTKEGVSVLLVDRRRAWEPIFLSDALDGDPRIRTTKVWLTGGRPAAGGEDLFRLNQPGQPYDVLVLGDVQPEQITDQSPKALEQIRQLVENGAGLVMLGGYNSFGNSAWESTPLKAVLPINFPRSRGRADGDVRMKPTAAGLAKYRYLLATGEGDPEAAWRLLTPLEGLARLTPTNTGTEDVLAVGDDPGARPILVARDFGKGRVLAFAGDTTHRWIRNPEGQRMHSRFWRRMMVWLARQEDQGGSVTVEPDVRRLPTGLGTGFRVAVRSKTGAALPNAEYEVRLVGPDEEEKPLSVLRTGDEDRGAFPAASAPGEYRIEVKGKAKDPETGEVIAGEARARLLVYESDREMSVRRASPDFLAKLAESGGGEAHHVSELADFLNNLPDRLPDTTRTRKDTWPDCDHPDRSPFLIAFFVAFVALVTGEWFLRRRWGLA